MKILIAGASGLVGTRLIEKLKDRGDTVITLVRDVAKKKSDTVVWNLMTGECDPALFEGFDGVINLAGENIAGGRWTKKRKQSIYDSRVKGTSALCRILKNLKDPPKVLVNASAIGFYGNTGKKEVDESDVAGNSFLSLVCRDWESATDPAAEKGIRVVNVRIGMVLSGSGGALQKMLVPFRLCLGGVIGSGKQYISWIALEDLVDIILFSVENSSLKGPVNAVSPHPMTNAEFTKTLAGVLHRPAVFPVPAFAVKILLGELGEELLLAGCRVKPGKLEAIGFPFAYPELQPALKKIIQT